MTRFFHQALVALAATGLLVFSSVQSLKAQSGPAVDAGAAFWSQIETQLAQPSSDSSLHSIFHLVRGHCGEDYDCLNRTYSALMKNLEERFNLPAAIFVTDEIVKIAQREKNLEAEALAYQNLYRFHRALGNKLLAAVNIDKALNRFERAGNRSAVVRAKTAILESGISDQSINKVLPEMNALLAQAIADHDTLGEEHLHIRLVGITLAAKRYEETAIHLAALESSPVSDPAQAIAITAALGRAALAVALNNLEEAEGFYQKTLRLCEAGNDPWNIINTLYALAELEWKRGHTALSKSYLEKARSKAEVLQVDELLALIFAKMAEIAEAEGRYADALAYTKKKYFHEEKHKNRSAGFDVQNYHLQQEKEQLETEKKNQGLELALKNTQLLYSLLVALLILLLAAGVSIAYRKQRQGKQKLSAQNTLIQQQSEQLKSLDAAKSRFFANVSHELRTPLALMLGPVGTLLKENQLTDKQAHLLQLAHQNGKQLEQLVTDILDLGKLEMGKMDLDKKPTELAAFFRRCLAQFESLADSKQIDFTFDIAVGNDVAANLDQAKCRQILNNLLSNAFKFTPPGGKVNVELKMENGEWKPEQPLHSQFSILNSKPSILHSPFSIRVSDTGPGIHPDDLPHLFDRYFQTTRPDKPAEGGTGIGLALCHEYAQLFGGKIEVESALGKGSEFRVVFPVTLTALYGETPVSPPMYSETPVSPAASAVGETGVSPYTTAAKPTILVVEDNPDLQAYIRLILEEKYHIVTAENGQAALERLTMDNGRWTADDRSLSAVHRPPSTVSLILSDLMMPVMDGHQLLERLKSDDATRHIPVIMLTARADMRDKLRALRIGVDDYLLKPFDEEELLVRIENLLRNQAARHTASAEETAPEAAAPLLSQPDREWLETYETYVQKHYADDTLSVSALAYQFAMSDSTLLRQLKRLTGLSPLQYLLEVRLNEARRLLENRAYNSISKLALEVGYSDAHSFSRSFKQRFGKLPSEMLGG